MKKLIPILLFLGACATSESEAKETLAKAGFTGVQLTGTDFFECGEKDKLGMGFRAINPIGIQTEGTVCCGVVKGCTVRF